MEHFLGARLSQEAYSKELPFRPSLTISRECGVGMDVIGGALVDYLSDVDDSTELGWALFDQEMVGKIIEDHNLPKGVAPFLSEKTKFPVVEALEQVLNLHPSEWSLFNYSADTIRNLCRMGNAIVVGRAGNFVTSDMDNTFHIRLVGSLNKRVSHFASRRGIPREQAAKLVKEIDGGREKFVRRYAKADWKVPTFYHLVLNTDDIPFDTVARIMGDSLLEWAHQKTLRDRPLLREGFAG